MIFITLWFHLALKEVALHDARKSEYLVKEASMVENMSTATT